MLITLLFLSTFETIINITVKLYYNYIIRYTVYKLCLGLIINVYRDDCIVYFRFSFTRQ